MGFFDIFKRKELDLIQTLQKDLECERQKSCEFEKKCESLSRFSEIADLDKEKNNILAQIACEKASFQEEKKNLILQIENLKIESDGLTESIKEKRNQIVELDESILLQDFGMYSPIYDFATSDEYKDRLDAIRTEQKNMILNKTAATCSRVWTVDGSTVQGRVMTNQNIKQILRCFNDECDMLISKVKFNNVTAYTDKIIKSFDAFNRTNSKNAVSLSTTYLNLKIEELQLAYEYAVKKQQEKDEQRRIREQMREEAKLQKELEEARKDIEKEQKHYSNALSKINEQLEKCDDVEKDVLLEKKAEIESHLSSLDKAMEDIDYRQANKRAGYVYIISNIGSFGENVYKIGMTRRLDPMERVDELGDASVPFKFDVHALIFSDDAPALETALHHAFENKKVNMINGRREFFNVTLDEIEEVVKANYDKTVEFVKVPEAEQYRETQKILYIFRSIPVHFPAAY